MPYRGESLDVPRTLYQLNSAALKANFDCAVFGEQNGFLLPVFTRAARVSGAGRVYISAGMHGDEPAGPLTILAMLEKDQFSREIGWTIFPMLNPSGLHLNLRENHAGIDLNRDYLHPKTEEVRAHVAFIEKQEPWDLALAIHEDWEANGFYLYDTPTEFTKDWSVEIVKQVGKVCPIDLSEAIDEMAAVGGIIRPKLEAIHEDPKLRGRWPEVIYLHMTGKIRGTYTFEAPSSFDLPTRVQALQTAIGASVNQLLA